MSNFIFSAFADEISSDFTEQLEALVKLNIPYIELRGVNGQSFTTLTDTEILNVKALLAKYNISVWSLGSPIGKINTDGDFEEHKKLFTRIMDIGDMLNVKRIRMFSFYPEENITDEMFEAKVFSMIEELLQMSEARGFILCHENEKDIYGYSPDRVLKLVKHFNGRLRVVLDNGNFPFCGQPADQAYSMLKNYIEYLHIKDADEDGTIVPPGAGKAYIEELLRDISTDRPNDDIVITMEPHLMMFTGLSSLSKLDDIKHKYSYDSPYQAFETATNLVRHIISRI
ncbi:sugar phosphate isomerase/epimerase [Eubacteriales bacterium OttesenSCG-928-G02]|nr:sugar phosphate isomerase/epimerase [Eubacteriales bacterium OttesenSCG-928-G02]